MEISKLKEIFVTLNAAAAWHNGDKWRDSDDMTKRQEWELHRDQLLSAQSKVARMISEKSAEQVEPAAKICLVTDKRYPHFAAAEIQLYGGYEPKIGDNLYLNPPVKSDVKWPDRLANISHPSGNGDRVIGFIVSENDPIMGRCGLSEPLAWFRSVTIDRV